ncbi:MAG: magnesium transporter [Pseudomonadota bacterium]
MIVKSALDHAVHRHETAGHLATRGVPIARADELVGALLSRLPWHRLESVDLVLVTSDAGRYVGTVEIKALLAASPEVCLGDLVAADWPVVRPETDQEHAVAAASRAGVGALPVVDAQGHPLGVLSAVVLLEVMAAEHREDVNRLVGVLKDRRGARHALEDPPMHRVGRRLPWLLVGLALSTGATALMASYQRALEANVIIAFFIPALVYLTDAIGTQTEAIAVRGLSLSKKPLASILVSEIATGGAIGLLLGVIAALAIWLTFGDPRLGLGVGASLLVAGTIASCVGLVFPWLLSRLDIDPAFGSGPVATIVQDVLTILVYFLVIERVMAGA